jgi:uncharacterized cysteine cluster protein YcgN (CxxCxxCC family)
MQRLPLKLRPVASHNSVAARTPLPDVCVRCGQCCFEKHYDTWGGVVYTDIPCQFLDLETRLCTVYPDRQRCREGCVPVSLEVVAEGWLPPECVYYTYFSPGPPDLRESFPGSDPSGPLGA